MSDIKKSAEVVDKLINHVCYKKTEGKLYLMTERLGWMTNTSEQFKISESYKNIRMQRISPDDKDKVQLQLLIYSGSSYTFQFVHPEGKSQQMRDRNEVKNHLQHILPKFKDKATSELEHKKKLCESNPQILELYRELVAGKFICKEEFWAQTESKCDLLTTLDGSDYPRGVPSCLMTVLPESSTSNEKYNLSEQMIEDIFQVYPSIKRKYNQSENKNDNAKCEFWKQFFQSHYCHRTRSKLSQDTFASCADQDIMELRAVAEQLRQNYDYTAEDRPNDFVDDLEQISVTDDSKIAKYSSLELLKRFNRHTFMLLQAMDRGTKRQLDCNTAETLNNKRALYDDDERKTITADDNCTFAVPFNTSRVTEYINKMAESNNLSLSNDNRKKDNVNSEESRQRLANMKKSLANAVNNNRSLINLMSSSVATDVLTTVGHLFSNADGALGNYTQSSRSFSAVNSDMEKEIKTLYRVVSELLRHFWSCFPITNALGFEKLHRLKDSLKRFKEQRLDLFTQQHSNYYLLTGSMENKATDHLSLMIDTALDTFNRFIDNYNLINRNKDTQSFLL